ncbi:MAG: GHKL domain-containing protein [Bacteroidales bacterium]|nr:GHKL domain-containing protein [Bacteroidales bacterium]
MNTYRYIVLLAILIAVAIVSDVVLDNWHYKEGDHRRLQQKLNAKFRLTDRYYDKLSQSGWDHDLQIPMEEGIIFVAYRNDSLCYWSDNNISFDIFSKNNLGVSRFGFISNGWYAVKSYTRDSVSAYGLILIKSNYPYENSFLLNGFHPDLKLPVSTELFSQPQPGSYSILDWEGIYLFSIKFRVDEMRYAQLEKYLLPSFVLIILIGLLLFVRHLIARIGSRRLKNTLVLMLPVILVFLRWLQYRYHIPADLYELEMFGPIPFAKSIWLPSLGDMLLNSLLVLYAVIVFHFDFKFRESVSGRKWVIAVLVVLLTGFYLYSHFILSNLILHSIISFEFYKAASLNIYTFVGLLIMAMHFAGLLLLAGKLLTYCSIACKFHKLMLIFLLTSVVLFLALALVNEDTDIGSHIAYLVMVFVISVIHYRRIPLGNYTAMAFMVIFFSAYSVYIITHYAERKMMNNMGVMAENLAAEHDPVAEFLLEDVTLRLEKDKTLVRYMFDLGISIEQIHNYLQGNYFNGFWGKYSFIIMDCDSTSSEIFDRGTLENCYGFYNALIDSSKGMQLPNTSFYFLDSQNGRINYLGWIRYKHPGRSVERSLFIELKSRLVAEELGFPELLLDKKYHQNKLAEEYSYAKYYRNQLLAQSGTFQYSLDLNTYKGKSGKFDGYTHLIYDLGKDNVVMVSKPSTTFFDKLISFSYTFIFYYMLVLLFMVIKDFSQLGKDFEFNFKKKIQFSIIATIFLSLFLIGGGTIYFSIQQYQKKQHDILSEKIQSVYIELDHLLAYLPNRIPPDWRNEEFNNLNQVLIKFSDVFYSDINLYDPQGNLLATSRTEIFDKGILGDKMNPRAYSKMVKEKQAEFIHRENIGRLSFMSAYVPFVNADNKLLAYLNLPYFTRQNVLRSDVTTLVVAIVNIYVLLILITIAMAVIISDQITRPLRLIQQKFSQIKLGKKSEQIFYKGHDEIAGLVDEYNRMVKELARSVEKLARSERESAWREMAKQVAHEIKNPLTPMKLSVQHLERSWKDNKENFEEYLVKVTRTLIEQIDTLSFIASEFSNFAKMPKACNEEINIVEIIRSTLNLFANTDNIDFVFEHESEKIMVFADKEQLSRVFINLIKNAIQSVPETRKGKVGVSIVQSGSRIRVSVTDNGKGIPEELQPKMFTPSFTTKSSGMGLGLSIVKSIIESFGGQISFNTKVNHGTTFVFELPVYESIADKGFEGPSNS